MEDIEYLESLKARGKQYWCRACRAYKKVTVVKEKKKSDCFVATATYQSNSAPEVVFLREYRDTVLRVHAVGRCFITAYYSVGPYMAWFVDTIPVLRPYVRRTLDKLVTRIQAANPQIHIDRRP